jgi:hypothetical protein
MHQQEIYFKQAKHLLSHINNMAKQRSYKKEFIEKVKQKFYHDLQPNSNGYANNNASTCNDKAGKVCNTVRVVKSR